MAYIEGHSELDFTFLLHDLIEAKCSDVHLDNFITGVEYKLDIILCNWWVKKHLLNPD